MKPNSTTRYLTKEEVEEFQRLCKVVKGINLTYEEAEEQASRLIQAFDLITDNKYLLESRKET